jgi:hypothetical protein
VIYKKREENEDEKKEKKCINASKNDVASSTIEKKAKGEIL